MSLAFGIAYSQFVYDVPWFNATVAPALLQISVLIDIRGLFSAILLLVSTMYRFFTRRLH